MRPAKERQPETCFARFQAAFGLNFRLPWVKETRYGRHQTAI
ncbi:MAG: hypothetical protein ACFNS8_00090 [Kingella oralis]